MNLFSKLRQCRERRAYERQVQYRAQHMPYGAMHASVIARRRALRNRHISDAEREFKARVRQAFLNHSAATPEDFDQCWPQLKREILVRYTLEQLEDCFLPARDERLSRRAQ